VVNKKPNLDQGGGREVECVPLNEKFPGADKCRVLSRDGKGDLVRTVGNGRGSRNVAQRGDFKKKRTLWVLDVETSKRGARTRKLHGGEGEHLL